VGGSPYRTVALRPGGGAQACPDAGFSGNVQSPGALSFDNFNNIYFGDNAANAISFNFDGGWQPRAGWPVATTLNINAPTVTGNTIVAGAAGPGGQILSIPTTGGLVNWRFPAIAGPNQVWNPAIISNNAIYGDDGLNLTQITVGAGSATAVVPSSGVIKGTPAIGQGSIVYTGDTSGTVTAWTLNLSTPALWSVSLNGLGSGQIQSGPTLDCARNAVGVPVPGRPGVLYVATDSGLLFSFVVDSRGIDTTAPWPKYQHDPRNTGNLQTLLAPFACP
jgi:hypothetical protein